MTKTVTGYQYILSFQEKYKTQVENALKAITKPTPKATPKPTPPQPKKQKQINEREATDYVMEQQKKKQKSTESTEDVTKRKNEAKAKADAAEAARAKAQADAEAANKKQKMERIAEKKTIEADPNYEAFKAHYENGCHTLQWKPENEKHFNEVKTAYHNWKEDIEREAADDDDTCFDEWETLKQHEYLETLLTEEPHKALEKIQGPVFENSQYTVEKFASWLKDGSSQTSKFKGITEINGDPFDEDEMDMDEDKVYLFVHYIRDEFPQNSDAITLTFKDNDDEEEADEDEEDEEDEEDDEDEDE